MKYRRHAETVDAFQWQPDMRLSDMPPWAFTALVSHRLRQRPDGSLTVPTVWGNELAAPGDWVLRDADDGLRSLRPDVFAMHFEPLEHA